MFIQVSKNADGSHAFQVGGTLQEGWAAIPPDMPIPETFPYVDIETAMVTHPAVITYEEKEIDGENVKVEKVLSPEYSQLEVVSITDGVQIDVEEPTYIDPQEDTDAMLVDHEYRLTLLELGLTEY